ncbi:hypothetical protein [uncultured Clostridium sp.]|uniref:hypothetical protein n=1 Tax=uncultured Clostridium sp. TaxID=59620 RepID=UPI0025F4DEAE|nr:hypothetical protein [uncultured Clostridium sp.]
MKPGNLTIRNKFIYRDFNYWENSFYDFNTGHEGCFNNKTKLTSESKIIYAGFLNSEKNILEHSFSAYPSTYSLLGFIQNIFLSTGFFTWFDTHYDEFCIPMDEFHNVVHEIMSSNVTDSKKVKLFEESYEFLDALWGADEDTILKELLNFCDKFNLQWDCDCDKKLFIKIFNSSEEIYDFVMDTIGWDCDEFIEEEISMSRDCFKNTCENVLSQPFINEKFMDILNINMPLLF